VLANGLEEPKVCDPHLAIDEDSEGEILELIEDQTEKCKPIPRTDIRHYCEVNIPVWLAENELTFHFISSRQFDKNQKYTSRKPETGSATCFPRRNDMLFARVRPRNEGRIGF
jgi:hypothetical protein